MLSVSTLGKEITEKGGNGGWIRFSIYAGAEVVILTADDWFFDFL